jgi:hypothetical protein
MKTEIYNIVSGDGYSINPGHESYDKAIDAALRFKKSDYPAGTVGAEAKELRIEKVTTTTKVTPCDWKRTL